MNIIIPINLLQIYIALGIRVIGLCLMLLVVRRMYQEYRRDNIVKRTKTILLVFGIVFFLISLIPVQQSACFLLGCFDVNSTLSFGIITALLNFTSTIMFLILYYTQEEIDTK